MYCVLVSLRMYWDQVCAVVTDPTRGYAGISLLAIEAGTPGFACAKTVGKIGKLASDTCLMTMKNCRVRNVLDHFLRRVFLCHMHFFFFSPSVSVCSRQHMYYVVHFFSIFFCS